MRKNNPPSAERSKIRVLWVDADLAPGDMENLTSTLTSAIRPTHIVTTARGTPRLTPVSAEELHDNGSNGTDTVLATDAEVAREPEVEEATAAATRSGTPKKRNYRKPQVVDMDMKVGDKPWAEFAAEKGPTTHRNKYMVAMTWLHEHAKVPVVTVDHVYTCYKTAGWTFDVSDPSVTFRGLKQDTLATSKDGGFILNHVGLAEVEKMKAE